MKRGPKEGAPAEERGESPAKEKREEKMPGGEPGEMVHQMPKTRVPHGDTHPNIKD
jgi:hypothetical protein